MSGADAEHALAVTRARYAQLVSEPFCVPMDRLARLTDRQMEDVYFHRRTKEGAIEAPEPPAPARGSPQEKAAFFTLCATLGIPLARAEEEWERKRGE
jgi:hypothetical protein